MRNFLLYFAISVCAMQTHAQQADNSATVFISNLSMQQADASGALPVKLMSFDGHAEQNKVVLAWQTAMELNNSHFEVLRLSPEKHDPVLIGRVAGNGNSNTISAYSYTDHEPLSGNNYYQLKQVDLDGGYFLSKIVAVNTGLLNTEFRIYQAAYGTYVARIFCDDNAPVSLRLLDINGRVINIVKTSVKKGANLIEVCTSPLPSGTYIVNLFLNGMQASAKFVVY